MAKYRFETAFELYFIEVCTTSKSMNQAAIALNMNYKTLCNHAKGWDVLKRIKQAKGFLSLL
ncbi:MAG: hypothetical protein SFV22_04850 [Saprospiraceae bacterium]|nr:hypothetical protein [Saprospiraceae bacterium]